MVQAFRFDGRGVTHRARVLARPKLSRETEAGRRLYWGFGTAIHGGSPVRRLDERRSHIGGHKRSAAAEDRVHPMCYPDNGGVPLAEQHPANPVSTRDLKVHACVEREDPLPEFVIKPDAARIKRRRWGTKPWQAHEEVCGRPLSNRWLRWTSAIHPSTLSGGIPRLDRFLASSASVRSRARPALAIPVPENTMTAHPTQLAKDFRHVAKLAGFSLAASDLTIESLSAPHRPPTRLPPGTMAVYLFRHQRWAAC